MPFSIVNSHIIKRVMIHVYIQVLKQPYIILAQITAQSVLQ